MSDETALARLFNTELREHSKDLDRIYHEGESAEAQIEAIGRVTDRAVFRTMKVELTCQAAEHFAPSGAPKYDMLTMTSAMAMSSVIARLGQER